MDLETTIEENIKGRMAAEKLMEKVVAEADKLSQKARERFWNCLCESVQKKLPKKDSNNEPMTDKECRLFGDTVMEFGQHKGKYIDDIDLSYLEWLGDEQTRFSRQLRRYLASKRIKRES